MQYGEAKWIIHPLGVKVRLMEPDDWDEVWDTCDFPIDDTDYAGVEHLKQRLYELNLIDGMERELGFFQIEPLDADWKTKHLDHCRDEYGPSTEMYHKDNISPYWHCEKDPSRRFGKKLDDYVDEKWKQYKQENEGNPYIRENSEEIRQWTEEFCKKNNLGRAIPMFLAQYQEDVEWIEEHIKQEIEEVRKPDGRGRNPNSLANLRQFKKEVVQ